jgi:hypothetical protein
MVKVEVGQTYEFVTDTYQVVYLVTGLRPQQGRIDILVLAASDHRVGIFEVGCGRWISDGHLFVRDGKLVS